MKAIEVSMMTGMPVNTGKIIDKYAGKFVWIAGGKSDGVVIENTDLIHSGGATETFHGFQAGINRDSEKAISVGGRKNPNISAGDVLYMCDIPIDKIFIGADFKFDSIFVIDGEVWEHERSMRGFIEFIWDEYGTTYNADSGRQE